MFHEFPVVGPSVVFCPVLPPANYLFVILELCEQVGAPPNLPGREVDPPQTCVPSESAVPPSRHGPARLISSLPARISTLLFHVPSIPMTSPTLELSSFVSILRHIAQDHIMLDRKEGLV